MNARRESLELQRRLRILVPESYREREDEVVPEPMGSAGLQFGDDGKVAWDQMWRSFCDLAMAGGPPHKGALLEPGVAARSAQEKYRYGLVMEEICRGIEMTTGLYAEASHHAGWVRVDCMSEGMSGWLARAIAMENVSVRLDGMAIYLPAGPDYRMEKEIRNVVTVVAKTFHYWVGHMSLAQRRAVAKLLVALEAETPLLQPPAAGTVVDAGVEVGLRAKIAGAIAEATGLVTGSNCYAGWVGLEVGSVSAAIGMMRGLVACNVFSRREGTVVFVPLNAGYHDDLVRRLVLQASQIRMNDSQ